MPTQIKSSNISSTAISSDIIQDGTITYNHCEWYSPDVDDDVGALKLPRGNTDERPTVNVGGREKLTIDLTVSNPDIPHTDPAFDMMDPWIWSWTGNYNRNSMTSETVQADGSPTGLTLLRGSTYIFRNFSVGHRVFLKSQALSQAEYDAGNTDLYKLGTAEGVTNNGARRTEGETEPGVVTWTIPDDYAGSSVIIQHGQYGMNNVVPITTPATETLGYIRLNTDVGHDPDTQTGLEVYTGNGWKTVPFEDNVQAVQEHPTGTLTRLDMGALTESVTANIDDGLITGSDDSTRDGLGLVLSAFLENGKLSVNNNAIVVHDGSTGGGFPMMKDDMSNVTKDLVNKRHNRYLSDGQTVQFTNNDGLDQRVEFTGNVIAIDDFTLANSVSFTCNKDVTNSYFKFDLNFKPDVDCTLKLFKNGSMYSAITAKGGYYASHTDLVPMSFGDIVDFRIYRSDGASVVINNLERLLVEFVGS